MSRKLLMCLITFSILTAVFILGCAENTATNSNSSGVEEAGLPQSAPPVLVEKAADGIDSIETDNYANKKLEFYYYIPSKVLIDKQESHPILICMPGLSGRGESAVSAPIKQFADQEGFVIIAPSFTYDEANWSSQTSYQYPEAWSGQALLGIIDKVKEKNALNLAKLYLHGFSAGAQFSLRFALWKPELCAACAVHGAGGTVIPQSPNSVKFFVSVGKDDTDRIAKTEAFYNAAIAQGIEVVNRQYEGGHSLPASQIADTLKFFRRVSGNDRGIQVEK